MTKTKQFKHYKIIVSRGVSLSPENLLAFYTGEASAYPKTKWWVKVEEQEPGSFVVVADNLTTDEDAGSLGFSSWDHEVKDLDAGTSAGSEYFNMSDHLQWNDVDMTPEKFKAPTVERLKQALEHVHFCAWDQRDF
ncbi:MAG: hypothetical protein WCT25_04035 [Candidatus Paceibacterota bacterium]|jgi:hypothetical protein